jgi:ubiquinone/menaquinone biosynthesis C-methylase UbiE
MDTHRRFDQTAEGWDAASDDYSRIFAPFTAQFAADVVRLYPPGSEDAVLEIAAGSGALTIELAKYARSVLATDISPRMVERIDANAPENVRAAVMDAMHIDVPTESYDAAYCLFGVMFFPDVGLGFQQVARSIKRGGACVIASWNRRSTLLDPIAAALEKVMPGSPPAQALSSPPVLGTAEEIGAQFRAAGFSGVEVEEVTRFFELPSREMYVQEFPRINPMGIAMQKMIPPPVSAALGAQIDAELAAKFGDGPVRLEGVANIARALRSA